MDKDGLIAIVCLGLIVASVCFGLAFSELYSEGIGWLVCGICTLMSLPIIYIFYDYLYNESCGIGRFFKRSYSARQKEK